jgi:hypothetical protein
MEKYELKNMLLNIGLGIVNADDRSKFITEADRLLKRFELLIAIEGTYDTYTMAKMLHKYGGLFARGVKTIHMVYKENGVLYSGFKTKFDINDYDKDMKWEVIVSRDYIMRILKEEFQLF